MISSLGLVAPIVMPQSAETGGYASVEAMVTVTVAGDAPESGERIFPLGVDVTVVGGTIQQLADGTVLPLETVLAPHQALVTFLPAGGTHQRASWPTPIGPFPRDAWLVDPGTALGWLGSVLPDGVPAPALWVLHGISRDSLEEPAGVLDQWLAGIPGVQQEAQFCHDHTIGADKGLTALDTWRARMLDGTWQEFVEAETLLGEASARDGEPVLTIAAYGPDGLELPATALLEALGQVNPTFMGDHPVVRPATTLAGTVPVRMYLRFDSWDVDASSASDPKGGERVLEPDLVRVVDHASGVDIPGATWTWIDPYGVLEMARDSVQTATFHVEAEFPAGTRIRLERGRTRFWPLSAAARLVWSTADWTARDGLTSGTWQQFGGVQVGSSSAPTAFWVGTKVRIAFSYQQQWRNEYGGKGTKIHKVENRRVAPGHEVGLYVAPTSMVDTFSTDEDGEVSGVSFSITPGGRLGAAVRRRLTVGGVDLRAVDDPTKSSTLFTDEYFWSEHATPPVLFSPFSAGAFAGPPGPIAVMIDADKRVDSRANTAHAAAFHALKFAKFTHDAVTLLKGDATHMPLENEFQLRLSAASDNAATYSYTPDPTQPNNVITMVSLPSSDWFTHRTIVHEYGHVIDRWISGTLTNVAARSAYDATTAAYDSRFQADRGQTTAWHDTAVLTNGGMALVEGTPLIIEYFLGVGGVLPHGTLPAPPGKENWPQYVFDVQEPGPANSRTKVALSARCGRQVEGVYASALFDYICAATGFDGFLILQHDSPTGYRQPQAYLDDWQNALSQADRAKKLAQLHGLVDWLFVDPLRFVIGVNYLSWSGIWPEPPATGGVRYPTVYDMLVRIQKRDPERNGPAPTPEESFTRLHDEALMPWNLEQVEKNEPTPPVIGPDWTP
jgi:hypothetical protein